MGPLVVLTAVRQDRYLAVGFDYEWARPFRTSPLQKSLVPNVVALRNIGSYGVTVVIVKVAAGTVLFKS